MTAPLDKHAVHLGVRFYRVAGVELTLVPLVDEAATFVRMAGDGYFLVALTGQPGTCYPVNFGSRATFDPDYLASKFHLRNGGFGCTPGELAAALERIAEDLAREEELDR